MGQVWLAEQTGAVKRQVALKVIKAGRFDQSALQRFDLERQSLAIMNHPAIARSSTPVPLRTAAVFCDGVCSRLSHYELLQPQEADEQGTVRTLYKGL